MVGWIGFRIILQFFAGVVTVNGGRKSGAREGMITRHSAVFSPNRGAQKGYALGLRSGRAGHRPEGANFRLRRFF